jgi:hypothetical protein
MDRLKYELCVLHTLRERLRCKEIWVVGASKSSSRPNVAGGNQLTVSVQKRSANALDADARTRSKRSGVGGSIPRSRKR